jgi:periplasmic protein TonB
MKKIFLLHLLLLFFSCSTTYKSEVIQKGEFSQGVSIRYAPKLEWPKRAIEEAITGWVILNFTIEANGKTSNVVVIDSYPPTYFDEAAISSVSKYLFNPKIENGKSIKLENYRVKLTFDIK